MEINSQNQFVFSSIHHHWWCANHGAQVKIVITNHKKYPNLKAQVKNCDEQSEV
jgi:hypothetical protein